MNRGWEHFEKYVAKLFDLDLTLASGSQFHDRGDAVTRGRQDAFPLYADAKYTERASFSLKIRELRHYTEAAAEQGKRLLVPLRFWLKGDYAPSDWVILSLHDLKELLMMGAGQDPPPTHPLLTQEESELLDTAHCEGTIYHQRWQLLIDKLRGTQI